MRPGSKVILLPGWPELNYRVLVSLWFYIEDDAQLRGREGYTGEGMGTFRDRLNHVHFSERLAVGPRNRVVQCIHEDTRCGLDWQSWEYPISQRGL